MTLSKDRTVTHKYKVLKLLTDAIKFEPHRSVAAVLPWKLNPMRRVEKIVRKPSFAIFTPAMCISLFSFILFYSLSRNCYMVDPLDVSSSSVELVFKASTVHPTDVELQNDMWLTFYRIANAELKQHFAKSREGAMRALKVSIENEELCLKKHFPTKGTWEQDFDKYVPGLIETDMPCYVLYRLDSSNSLGHDWLLLTWSPDSAPVRQKMLYASTKATLKQEFGSAYIKDDFHATAKEEVSLSGYRNHVSGAAAPAPLTQREEALKELQQNTHITEYSPSSRQSTLGGVSFPLTEAANKSLDDLSKGTYNYLQFRIDIEEEKIHLAKAANVELSRLAEEVPSDQARYHLYVFSHSHEGDHLDSIVFIYSMPGYSCSIKERMLYSSCKGPFSEMIEKTGLEIAKKLEIDDGKELTEEYLYEEVHPKRNLHRPAFAKPKGPPNRGAKRITKPQTTQ